jgi:hypothetical protein
MKYEIQTEFIPGNNQMWISLKTEDNKFIYAYSSLEEAETMLPALEAQSPDQKFRIVETEV